VGSGARVEVVRSTRRRSTTQASVRDGVVVVRVPARLTAAQEQAAVEQLLARLRERAATPPPATTLTAVPSRPTRSRRGERGDPWLAARADRVAARWLADHQVRASSATWSHRMHTRWASITIPPGRMRVSHRLADAPDEVIDNTLLHELAHLVHAGHGRGFRTLLARDPAGPQVEAWLARRTHRDLCAALGMPWPSPTTPAPR
jgi:predicted metal-dependent hydrolase